MKEKLDPTIEKKTTGNLNTLDFLAKLGELDKNDRKLLEEKILPKKQEEFEKIPEVDKMIMTLLVTLSEDEIKELTQLQRELDRIVGIHQISSKLSKLSTLTGDNKYQDYYKNDGEE